MRIKLLGTAAGGGQPQWNCGCPHCAQARTTGRHRSQDCVAITADGSHWYLVNASADLRAQLLASPELAPTPGTRDTPLAGLLLTSGELDHTLGMLTLREAASIRVFATGAVLAALPFAATLAAYTDVEWCVVTPGSPFALAGGLEVVAFAPGDKRPRYAAARPGGEWTVAYRFSDPCTGGVLVYAPGLARWSQAFADGIAGADVVLLDGTFATPTELGDAPSMGHLSIADSLPLLAAHPGPRYVYTHLNNTNPFASGRGLEADQLSAANAWIARDGEVFEL
jgi:pyrroloquinoline quinone biosynthesis protein B